MLHLSIPLWLVLAGDVPLFAAGAYLSYHFGARAVAVAQAVKADVAPVAAAASAVANAAQAAAQDVKKA